VTQEQREELDRLIDALKAGARLTASDVGQVLGFLLALKDLVYRLHGEWDKVKAKLNADETVDEWGKPDWVGKEVRK